MDKQQALRFIAPTAFASGFAVNYACHKLGLPTLSSNTRMTAHTETLHGKVIVGSVLTVFNIWIWPHLLLTKNQHHVK